MASIVFTQVHAENYQNYTKYTQHSSELSGIHTDSYKAQLSAHASSRESLLTYLPVLVPSIYVLMMRDTLERAEKDFPDQMAAHISRPHRLLVGRMFAPIVKS